ncbi:MAG: zinc ribbon domain-containing protein [Planctomycetota bacterium]
MPLFEYRCRQCGSRFEALIRNAAQERQTICESCGSPKIERLMSAPAVQTATVGLPIAEECPPIGEGPCSPTCCRLPG